MTVAPPRSCEPVTADTLLNVVRDYVERQSWPPALRAIRSQRPALSVGGARAKTFSAGLEQAEQLWRASHSVDSVASPLLLFYGLTQAGRAICAAGTRGGQWRPTAGHGLTFDCTTPSSNESLQLPDVTVAEHGSGLIQSVAAVLTSPVLSKPATLATLIASLDSDLLFSTDQAPGPRPLAVWRDGLLNMAKWSDPAIPGLRIHPMPAHWAERRTHIPAGPNNLAYTRIDKPSVHEVEDWLAPYPRLYALGRPTDVSSPEPSTFTDEFEKSYAVRIRWDDETDVEGQNQRDWTLGRVDVIYDRSFDGANGVALPAVGRNAQAQHLLVTWWLVLYSLSMVARYFPREWTAVLDVDRSPLAVPLDHLISVARERVPFLILDVLTRLPDGEPKDVAAGSSAT